MYTTSKSEQKQSILVMWIECRLLDTVTDIDGSNPASACCVLEQDNFSALLQSTQLRDEYQVGTTSRRVFSAMRFSEE